MSSNPYGCLSSYLGASSCYDVNSQTYELLCNGITGRELDLSPDFSHLTTDDYIDLMSSLYLILLDSYDFDFQEFERDYSLGKKLTFEAEGMEGGKYHSRVPHFPGGASGVTIGRGYDLKERSQASVRSDLLNAGVAEDVADLISKGAGKKGQDAQRFVKDLNTLGVEITSEQQHRLFEQVYSEKAVDVNRLLTKSDVAEIYGMVDLQQLPVEAHEFLIDLHFRGDFTPTSRITLVSGIIESQKTGNYSSFWKAADSFNRGNTNVPEDRRQRRGKFIKDYY